MKAKVLSLLYQISALRECFYILLHDELEMVFVVCYYTLRSN